jgi:hypothetical protein
MKFIKIIVVILSLGFGSAQAQTYLPDVSSNPLFGELLWHTLAYRQDVAVYPGEFAPRMPLEVVIPEGGRLIGSVVREYGSRTREVTVVIDSKLTYEEVGGFYRPKVKAPWIEKLPTPSGFSFSRDVRNGGGYLPLCNAQTGTRVDVYANPKNESNWETSPSFIYVRFFESSQVRNCDDTPWQFPVLIVPSNVEPFGGNGANFGDFNCTAFAFNARNTNSRKIFEGLAAQLPSTWQRISISEDETSMQAIYRYTDPKQSGIAILSVSSYKERPDAYSARLVALPQL